MKMRLSLRRLLGCVPVIAMPFIVHAQGNLVNLYDWTGQTMYGVSLDSGIYISSATSAMFFGSYSTNVFSGPDHIIPVLTGNLGTTPGATYEISYTLAHDGGFIYCDGSMSFGSYNFGIQLPYGYDPDLPPRSPILQNFYALVTATAPSTTMSFVWSAIDNGDAAFLTDFSVVAVPEVSVARLCGLGGCVLVLAQQRRRSFPNRQRNRGGSFGKRKAETRN